MSTTKLPLALLGAHISITSQAHSQDLAIKYIEIFHHTDRQVSFQFQFSLQPAQKSNPKMALPEENPIYGPFFGVMGAAAAIIFSGE